MHDESLFRDDRVFDRDYVPEIFNFRDGQLQEIALCLKPGMKGGRPLNVIITGPPATGKTTAIKKMFEEMEGLTDRLICIHVNCQIQSAKFSIFSQIHKRVIGHLPPETGVPFTKVYESIFKKMIKEDKSLAVALDDLNYLYTNGRANEVIYDILRAHEVFPGVKTGVLGVVSDVRFDYKFDEKVASIFRPREIFFQPYNRNEVFEILRDRARLGFPPGVISDEMIGKIADFVIAHGDLRMGIETLRISALIAESEASRKITAEHVERSYGQSKFTNLKSIVASLSDDERAVLKSLAGGGGMDSGELYERLKAKSTMSYSTFYRILDKLESTRLVDAVHSTKGKKGRTRWISLRHGGEIEKALGA